MTNWPAVVVASSALLFTVGSFWWLHARRGKLRMPSAPTRYAGAFGAGDPILRLPIALHNSGPLPYLIQEMRVEVDGTHHLKWQTSVSSIDPREKEPRDFLDALVVEGRALKVVHIEFITRGSKWRPEPLSRPSFALQVKVKGKWRTLAHFTLQMPHKGTIGNYITHEGENCECSP